MEKFFSRLKTECIYMDPLETAEEMKQAVLQYATMNGYKRNKTAVALKNIWLQLLNIGVSTNPNDPFY
jgi:Integrase core domain